MKQFRSSAKPPLILAILVTTLVLLQAQNGAKAKRIAVFGSSVAYGTGDTRDQEGYTGRLRANLAGGGWEVLNQSRPGDTTRTLAARFAPTGASPRHLPYLLPVNPAYVLLALSLGNEGIARGSTRQEKDAVFKQFETGIQGLVERSRQHHITPIVALCYTRNDFTEVEYQYTRRMNLLINAWDVPSVNFLGAVDDGHGRWASGFWSDALHPNAAGYDELAATFVPTLFEALGRGKPRPTKSISAGFARSQGGEAFTYAPEGTLHSFTLALSVRARLDGSVASIAGSRLTAKTSRMGLAESTTLSAHEGFNAALSVAAGRWSYATADGGSIASGIKADGDWHRLVVSHYTARGETLFFVDGILAGRASERLEPKRFSLGSPQALGPGHVIDLRDLLIYRSALNADEVAALAAGALLQASLDVYAPLADSKFARGSPVENRAQSLSKVKASANVVHAER